MAHTMRPGTIAIELPGHGEFATSIEFAAKIDGKAADCVWMGKRDLARNIADAYGGNMGDASSVSYWMRYPRTVLVIVYGGMVEPRN